MKTQKNPQNVNPRKCNRCWSWFTATAVAVIAISFANRSSAVPVTFSGGSGTPLTITLSEPVTYQITLSVPVDSAPFFVLQDVTNGESGIGEYELSGNVT